MTEIKIPKGEVDSLPMRAIAACKHATTNWSSCFFSSLNRAMWLKRMNIFAQGVQLLVDNYDTRAHKVVLHYEGASVESATYLEIQLVAANDENDIIGCFAAKLKP